MIRGASASHGSLRKLLVVLLIACFAPAAFAAASASAAGVVPTDKGPVRGVETGPVKQYLGIPYAAPPVGDLRWRAPQAPDRWRTPRNASQFGDHCAQTASPFGFESSSEDCLYLNVFAPNVRGRDHKDRPVMVWFHGGGLTVGESDDYDPTRLVQRGVIVVTVNYRLGYLGFLSHPALSEESPTGASGNYGLMDQQASLRWVERNIKKFGGDTDNVTIFGQSAGGLSVHAHLASPKSAGLFDRAISQSGAYDIGSPTLAEAEAAGESVAVNAGCGSDQTATCLRALPVGSLLAVQPEIAGELVPNVDGDVLPQSIGSSIESGEFNRVPVIEGSTHDEFTIFTALFVEPLVGPNPPAFFYPVIVGVLASTLGLSASGPDIAAQYPLADYPGVLPAISAIATDAIFACPARRTAGELSEHVPVFQYELNDPDAPQIFVPPTSYPFGSYHAADVLYLFDSPLRGGHAPFNADQEALAATMVTYWGRFARAGSPNRTGVPHWPGYTTATDTAMSFVPPTPVPTTGFADDHKCGFWDSHTGT